MKTEIQERLDKLAFKKSFPFCYGCYRRAPTGRCEICHSDDLMRETSNGVEYGTGHVIEEILGAELAVVNLEEEFEESVRQCYPETTKVAWMEFDTATLAKEMDPVAWRCALVDYESQEESEGNIISFDGGSQYYRCQDIEDLLNSEGV